MIFGIESVLDDRFMEPLCLIEHIVARFGRGR